MILQNYTIIMEETLNLQRQEITTLNEIVNEMKLHAKWDKNRQDTMLVNEKQFNHKNSILENQQQYQAKNTSEVNQSQSSRRPDTNFEKKLTPTRIQTKRRPMMDKKDTNSIRRSEIPINRGL